MFFTYSIFAFLLGRINIILPVAGLNLSLIIFGIAIANTVIALLYGTNRKKVNKQKA